MIKIIFTFSLLILISGCSAINMTNKNANIHVNKYGLNANIYTNIEF